MADDNSASFTSVNSPTAPFSLRGGKFGLDAHGNWGSGYIQLNRLAADGVTFIPVTPPINVDGLSVFDLPPGSYQVAVVSATVSIAIVRIPER
jgi:hypothetical protein